MYGNRELRGGQLAAEKSWNTASECVREIVVDSRKALLRLHGASRSQQPKVRQTAALAKLASVNCCSQLQAITRIPDRRYPPPMDAGLKHNDYTSRAYEAQQPVHCLALAHGPSFHRVDCSPRLQSHLSISSAREK